MQHTQDEINKIFDDVKAGLWDDQTAHRPRIRHETEHEDCITVPFDVPHGVAVYRRVPGKPWVDASLIPDIDLSKS